MLPSKWSGEGEGGGEGKGTRDSVAVAILQLEHEDYFPVVLLTLLGILISSTSLKLPCFPRHLYNSSSTSLHPPLLL